MPPLAQFVSLPNLFKRKYIAYMRTQMTPEIMSQGETVEELEENLKDAYKSILMDDVPSDYQLKEISV